MKKIEIIGEKFGKLKVISVHSKTRDGHERYICSCDCGNNHNVLKAHLLSGKITSCGCGRPKGSSHKQWDGVGDISGDFWYNHIIRSATGDKGKRKELELSIDKTYAWNLFLFQNKKCALSGLSLKFPEKYKDKTYTASLDRIDSSKGYVEGNVQWVHKDINLMKNKFDQDYFINICKLISQNV